MSRDFARLIYSYSQEDKEILCSKSGHSLAIRIGDYYLIWDTLDLNCYQIDSVQFAHFRDNVYKHCSTLDDFIFEVPKKYNFIKTVLKDNFLSKVFRQPGGEKFSMYFKIEYPVDDSSIAVEIYFHSWEYLKYHNNWYICIHDDGFTYDFEITSDNKIRCVAPDSSVDFYSQQPETVSIEHLPDEGKELLKLFIDSGAYRYMLHPQVNLDNYSISSRLSKVIPEKDDETNLFG